MLFLIDHACFCRLVVFRGFPGINNSMIGTVPVLCENAQRQAGAAIKELYDKVAPKQSWASLGLAVGIL